MPVYISTDRSVREVFGVKVRNITASYGSSKEVSYWLNEKRLMTLSVVVELGNSESNTMHDEKRKKEERRKEFGFMNLKRANYFRVCSPHCREKLQSD